MSYSNDWSLERAKAAQGRGLRQGGETVILDGQSLDLARIVGIARLVAITVLDEDYSQVIGSAFKFR